MGEGGRTNVRGRKMNVIQLFEGTGQHMQNEFDRILANRMQGNLEISKIPQPPHACT